MTRKVSIELTWDQADRLVIHELTEYKKTLEIALQDRFNDTGMAIFHTDKTKDIFELKRVIDSLEVVLRLYLADKPSIEEKVILGHRYET